MHKNLLFVSLFVSLSVVNQAYAVETKSVNKSSWSLFKYPHYDVTQVPHTTILHINYNNSYTYDKTESKVKKHMVL